MPASSDKSNAASDKIQDEKKDIEKAAPHEDAIDDGLNKDTILNKDEGKAEAVHVSPLDDEEEADEEASPASEKEKEHADILRRKRDREGSLEPSISSQQGISTPDAIPTKKNRLQDSVIGEEQPPSSSLAAPSSPNHKGLEGEKVGQIRKRVQDLSWKQRKEGDRDGEEEEVEERNPEDETAEKVESSTEITSEPKRSQPSFSSFSSKPSAFAASAASKKDENNFLSSPSSSTEKKASSPTSAERTQPTFSSFSKSSSPFNTASNVAGPSWLAGKSGNHATASPVGGMRPSALGSVGSPSGSSSEATASAAPTEKDAQRPKNASISTGNKQLGFGAFASNKTFGSRSSTPTTSSEKQANGDDSEGSSHGQSFDEVLRKGEEKEEGVEANKVSTQLDRGEADLRTGEEDERALTSARAKLFTMSEDKTWKERGTGTVRCNVGKKQGGGARLVMRSEGVLRLILNINLFKGMKINLEQDKFLRIVAMENEKLVHFAIKFANPMTASNFYQIVKETIPADDGEDQA